MTPIASPEQTSRSESTSPGRCFRPAATRVECRSMTSFTGSRMTRANSGLWRTPSLAAAHMRVWCPANSAANSGERPRCSDCEATTRRSTYSRRVARSDSPCASGSRSARRYAVPMALASSMMRSWRSMKRVAAPPKENASSRPSMPSVAPWMEPTCTPPGACRFETARRPRRRPISSETMRPIRMAAMSTSGDPNGCSTSTRTFYGNRRGRRATAAGRPPPSHAACR